MKENIIITICVWTFLFVFSVIVEINNNNFSSWCIDHHGPFPGNPSHVAAPLKRFDYIWPVRPVACWLSEDVTWN